MKTNEIKIGFIGLGYAGFPTACLLAEKYDLVGFDLSEARINSLKQCHDTCNDVTPERIKAILDRGTVLTTDKDMLKDCNLFIITVPTPIDSNNLPDLSYVISASEEVASVLKKGDIVTYESTVYPGTTEEVCVPVLEEKSGLKFNEDFFVGFSPERINPGDRVHTVTNTVKITSGSTPEAAKIIDEVYSSILENGTYLAPSIKVAEAAKVIENTQRDVNIALMNEIAVICNKIGIDTNDVIDAASSKWNFLPFRPGLVGGHCISVDPYYLIDNAMHHGVVADLMITARRINNHMGLFVAQEVTKLMREKGLNPNAANILILGFTFKENCPDARNTKVIDIYSGLKDYTSNITVFDPWVDAAKVKHEYGVNLTTDVNDITGKKYDAIILAVAHDDFKSLKPQDMIVENGVIYDVKGKLPRDIVTARL